MGARFYDAALGRWLSPDVIVPGTAASSGGTAATLGYDDQVRLTPLTVGFHETQFLSVVGEENREIAAKGFWFQRSKREQSQSKYQWGPPNPQALNRYGYCLNNLLRYIDPSGHQGDPPSWLQELILVWRNPPDWARDLFFVAGRGTRIIHINGPHPGAEYWHINSDLRLLQGLDHGSIEPFFEKLALARTYVESVVGTITDLEWLSIFEKIPVIVVPEFLVDPEYWFKQQFPELFEEVPA
jgi:hypothetical protein